MSQNSEMQKKKRMKNLWEALKLELREHKSSFLVYVTLRLLVIAVMVLQLLNRNYENVFLCVLTLFLLIIPSFVQVTFRVELPSTLEIIILIFIFAAEILGEISEFYLVFPFWDTVLHTMNGFLAAAIGLSLVDLLNRSKRMVFHLSPLFAAIVAFCFSMTIGVMWEFFEFGMDMLLNLDMQKDTVIHTISSVTLDPQGKNIPYVIRGITETAVNGAELGLGGYLDIGLIDTMEDLFVNFAGALTFSVIGYFYVRSQGKKSMAERFIPRLKRRDRDYLSMLAQKAGEEAGVKKESRDGREEKSKDHKDDEKRDGSF